MMTSRLGSATAGIVMVLGLAAQPVLAQDEDAENARLAAETARLNAETARMTAETERMNAQAARINALPLPEFEDNTTFGAGGGTMEASILSADALGAAARWIATSGGLSGDEIVVVTGETMPNVIQGLAFRQEIDELNETLNRIHPDSDPAVTGGGIGLTGALTVASSLAGLLRSETELRYAATTHIDSDLLAMAVARALGGRAVLPGNVYGVGEGGRELLSDFQDLADRVALVTRAHGQTPFTGENLRIFQGATARFTAFNTTAMKAGANGLPALHDAARLLGVYGEDTNVLRVEVHQAGGSMTNSSNIGTFFGADPVRVSGGLVVSYSQFDPDNGRMLAGDLLTCTTTFTSIRRVQDRSWEERGGGAVCTSRLTP